MPGSWGKRNETKRAFFNLIDSLIKSELSPAQGASPDSSFLNRNVIPFLSNFLLFHFLYPVMVNFSKVDVGSEDQMQHSFLLGFPERKRQLPSSVLCLLTWNESRDSFLFQVMEERKIHQGEFLLLLSKEVSCPENKRTFSSLVWTKKCGG
jgi:hypothetical protein